jgi:hypothetical protein
VGHHADGLLDKSILIVRTDNLGDAGLFSGTLKPIRKKWPASRITICVKRFVTDYLALCAYTDNILVREEVNDFLYRPFYKRRFFNLTRRTAVQRLKNLALSAFDSLTNCDLFFDLLLSPARSPFWDHHMLARAVQAQVRIVMSGDLFNQTPAQAPAE